MEIVRGFGKLGRQDVAIAGGKGASLGEMTQVGIPVPEGFVVLSEAFEAFIKETDLNVEIDAILDGVDTDKIHTVEEASEKIQALILEKEIPENIVRSITNSFNNLGAKYVAVRSSATSEDSASAAWAGQLDTFLNTTERTLLDNVRKCWASLFTPRAIFYRFEKSLHKTEISVAVVVQKMVDSEESGIAFSVHPVTEDPSQLIIESGFGLGESIVSGQITPDSYVVDKKDWHIIDININEQARGLFRTEGGGNEWKELGEQGKKQVLNEKEIVELSKLVVKIEDHYGFPVDIEWAKEKGKFYILQSRPITTLTQKQEEKKQSYIRLFTRDVCLITFEVWINSDTDYLKNWIGVTTDRIILENNEGVITGYEQPSFIDKAGEKIKELLKDEDWFDKQIKRYQEETRKTKQLIKKLSKELTIENIKVLHDQLTVTQGGLAIVYTIPNLKGIDERIENISLKERQGTEQVLYDADAVFEKSLKKIFPKIGDYVKQLTIKEIITRKVPNVAELKKRKDHYLYYDHEVFLGKDLKQIEKELNVELESSDIDENVEELKGKVASKGKVKGKVRVVMTKDSLGKVGEGDILVTSMTNPDFLPAMKKAAAFVTDEGGATCHAAIIAREMNKPCIIGTKIATKILKDGMEVEVDANEGVVRILESDEKFETEIDPESYSFFGLWKSSLLADWYWAHWFNQEYAKEIGLDLKDGGVFVINGGNFFLKKDTMERVRKFVGDIIENEDRTKLSKLKSFVNKIYKISLKESVQLVKLDPTSENVRKMAESGRRIMFPWCLGFMLSEVFDEFLTSATAGIDIKPEEVTALVPPPKTPLFESQKSLAKIKEKLQISGHWSRLLEDSNQALKLIKKDKQIMGLIAEHTKKYGWLSILNLVGEEPTVEDVIEQVTNVSPYSEEKKQIKKKLNKDLAFLVELAKVVFYLRQTGVEYFSMYSRDAITLFKKAAKQLDISYRELLDLNMDEVMKGLDGSDVKDLIKKRKGDKWIIYSNPNGEPKVIDDSEVISKLDSIMIPRAEATESDVIKGQVGNKGKSKGKVKVILASDDFDKMESGDVLVTTMTTPDFVPLMEKASAIVTDIGGLLCHAAIISRELNIPCVIGTKFAVQILKDGDLVEVDADNGIVKILEKVR